MKALERVHCAYKLLQYTYGLLFLAVGADKFLNMVTMWSKYLSPMLIGATPLEPVMLLQIIGIIEMVIGAAILSGCMTRLGALLATVWLLLVAGNLLSMNMYFDIAVRDLVMASGALALSKLASAHCEIAKERTR